MQQEKDLQSYETPAGRRPFEDWLDHLNDRKAIAIVKNRMDRLAHGLAGKCEPVGSGIFELKIYYGPAYRVYFAYDGLRIILLLIGGEKSTQRADIKKAKDYWEDYQTRK